MIQTIVLPLLAVLGGLGGHFLRRWELGSAFEAATGLAIPNAPATITLIAVSAVLVLVMALLCRGKHNTLTGYDQAFYSPNLGYIILSGVAAAHLLLSGVFGVMEYVNGTIPKLTRLLLAALCLAAFVCVAGLILNNFRGRKNGKYSFLLLTPAYMGCVWLIAAYQQRASDPVVLDYVYELFAIIATLLAFYFQAGFAFERAKVWRASFFSLLSIYFALVTMADGHDWPTVLLLRFVVLYQLATVTTLLYRAFAEKPQETQEVPQDEG